jgi:tetratricopeptide (TPR) repeat protein
MITTGKWRLCRYLVKTMVILLLSLSSNHLAGQTNPSIQIFKENQQTILSFYSATDSTEVMQTFHFIDDFFNSGHYKEALTLVNRMIQKDSAIWPCYMLNAAICMGMNDYQSCIRYCNLSLEYKPFPAIVALRGLSYYNTGKYSLARKDFDYIISTDKKYYLFDALWANYLASKNECVEAIKISRNALKYANDEWTCFYVAKSFFYCQQIDSGLFFVNESIRKLKTLDALKLRSRFHLYLHNDSAYLADKEIILIFLDSLITLNPDNAQLYEEKFYQLKAAGKYAEAEILIDKRIEMDNSADLLMSKFYLLRNQDRNDEAESCLKKAQILDSNNFNLNYELIDQFTQQHNYQKAIQLCDRIINAPAETYKKSDISYAYRKRGNAKYLSGDKVSGCEDISMAASMGNQDAKKILEQTCGLINKE